MRDRPSGAELLWQAREVLLRELLAELPEYKKYDALMVGAAMAIAAREQTAADAPLRDCHAALSRLYGEEGAQPADQTALREDLVRMISHLAQEIRCGRRDADGHVHALLYEIAEAKLRESNPKALSLAEKS
ncbi:DUF6285 domain-containing protein [Ferruginivarius sediminum]|uniref:DUF6285 domain-containing protein n=1 Tax=Ferruginivarius sediminum TaxID=2661937 RepID=A0A369TA15_9PROT|nr:DUF6285 domain-containing protein [Ferruginivarius sediminum]RDD62169.1 hypothetical protein DRB17_09250 [Ferruginivarius sediminum]